MQPLRGRRAAVDARPSKPLEQAIACGLADCGGLQEPEALAQVQGLLPHHELRQRAGARREYRGPSPRLGARLQLLPCHVLDAFHRRSVRERFHLRGQARSAFLDATRRIQRGRCDPVLYVLAARALDLRVGILSRIDSRICLQASRKSAIAAASSGLVTAFIWLPGTTANRPSGKAAANAWADPLSLSSAPATTSVGIRIRASADRKSVV